MGSREINSPHLSLFRNVKIRENSWIARFAAAKLKTDHVAIVIGKTIHLHNTRQEDFLRQEKWVKHEACHLAQFERYGFVLFILRYLVESLRHGYYNNKFEIEARFAEDN